MTATYLEIDAPMQLTCKYATSLMSQEFERELLSWERSGLRLHLVQCEDCNNVARQMVFVRGSMKWLAANDTPSYLQSIGRASNVHPVDSVPLLYLKHGPSSLYDFRQLHFCRK
jgi:hypothetical protein